MRDIFNFKPKIGLIKASLWVENILEGSDYLHKKVKNQKKKEKNFLSVEFI